MRAITVTFDGEPYLPGLLRLIAERQVEQLEKLQPGEAFHGPGYKVSLTEDLTAVQEVVSRDVNGAILGIDWRRQLGRPDA